jgi:hypothetical protein
MRKSSACELLGTLVLVAACAGDPDDRTPDAGRTRDAGQRNDSSASGDEDAEPGVEPDAAANPSGGSDAGSGLAGGASPYFSHGAFFLDDVSAAAKAANSDAAIKALRARGGFGNGDVFQIDFSIDVLSASASTEKKTFTTRTEANGLDDEFYTPEVIGRTNP